MVMQHGPIIDGDVNLPEHGVRVEFALRFFTNEYCHAPLD